MEEHSVRVHKESNHDLSQFRDLIRQLYENAPDAARAFATAILEHSPSDDTQKEPTAGNGEAVKRKRPSNRDPSYRAPRTAKTQTPNAGRPQGDGTKDIDDTVEVNGGVERSVNETSLLSDQQQQGAQDDLVFEGEDAPADRAKVEIVVDSAGTGNFETTETTSAPNMTKNQQPTVLHLVSETAPIAPAPTNASPARSMKRLRAVPSSPQTEEIHRAKIPTALESISSSHGSTTDPSSPEAAPLTDLIVEAVRIIHQFSKYPHAVPREVHPRILQTLRNDNQEAIVTSNLNQWSDGSMWMQVLEMGSTQNQRVTILNMLEYIGAWEWYDKQIELSQMTIRTKKNKAADRRGAAIHVLNKMQSMPLGSGPRGRWISGVGRVALTREGEVGVPQPDNDDHGIAERHRQAQRKRISMQLSRGQKLRTKLVKELGLGILFSPKIW